jgi:hypothetical protein
LGFRDFRIASAAPVTAAAAARPTPTFFAALFIFATLRLRCCFFTIEETALAAVSVKAVAVFPALPESVDALFDAFVASFPAFFTAFRTRVSIRPSGWLPACMKLSPEM